MAIEDLRSGMDQAAGGLLVNAANKVCPYSSAPRGNVAVKFSVV